MSIKVAKPKPKKSSAKSKGKDDRENAENGISLFREGLGLLLLSITLITVIALLSNFAKPGNGNILGPFLGEWWADQLNQFAGGMPILFLVAAAATLGFKLILDRGGLQVRIVLALTLLFLSAGMLLSIKNIAKVNLNSIDYQLSGGYLGNFLVQKCFQPIFGQSEFGPYLITSLVILFILVWGFRMSVVNLSEKSAATMVFVMRPFFLGLSQLWAKRDKETEEVLEGEPYGTDSVSAHLKTQPLKGTKDKTPKPLILELGIPSGTTKIGASSQEVLRSNEARDLGKAEEDLDELDLNDPLAVRKSRDLNLERKRVSELNEWEIKTRNPEIAGMLQKEKKAADSSLTSAGITEAETLEALKSAGKKKSKKKPALDETLDKFEAREEDKTLTPLALTMAEEDFLEGEESDQETDDESVDIDANVDKGNPDGNRAPNISKTRPILKPMANVTQRAIAPKPEIKYDVYRVPSLDDIFPEPPKQPLEFTEEELREQSKVLEDQLINFKVMGKVTQICPGPVITRYEVELAPGVKVSRISTLADDLALALKAKSIRILAPIPGKSVVGIEVPNRKAQIVYIKEILRAPEFALEEDSLKVCLGKSIGGEPYVMDMTRAPHLLIAGQTGSGKSVCINSIMASFLCSKTPDELRLILIDPKVVELKPYDAIPHLLYPVITQPPVAVSALKWATFEMDRRYETLAQCGVRNIKGFNAKFKAGTLPDTLDPEDIKLMAYIVIIIDELADLMMVAGKEVETNIARIAQKARAVGIHLILATQRPSTNVITGTIKANLPTRIAFQVASQIDARTIMDKMGAEKLLGRGDMLFRPIEFPEPVRLHGCYLDDDQAEKLASCASDQHVNYPQIQTFNLEDDPEMAGESGEPRDEKFREAAELVVQAKQASVSLLQRRLGIGYARSGRLVDQMERAGIVGRERGSKPREVLMNPEELQSFLSSGLNDD